jgi:carboxyl-terminal processing protease
MENNKKTYLIPLLLAVFLAVGLLLGSFFSSRTGFLNTANTEGGEKYQKIQDIIEILDKRYVDTVDGEKLFEETIGDMLHKLDPHSNYIPARDLQAMNESIEGKFGGVGVRFFVIRDTICITHVMVESPSLKAGLKAGDKIIQINGKPVANKKITTEKIMGMLKGVENTSVNVQILRAKKLINKQIIRGIIPISSIMCYNMINGTTGYIKIEQFSVNTAEEFRKAALALQSKGMTKLILDLRNNGGGVLRSATEIVDDFLKGDLPIVMTKGEHEETNTYRSTSGGFLESTKLAVLVNENSASASEIVAGALQDNDRGIVIGRRTFGKGLVQQDIQLRDGSNLRLTIARYYTPTGRCIQKPYTGDIEEYYQGQYDRYDNGELYKPDSSLFVDSLKFKTPKGKVVYGGGGIMPDIFVPFDSTGMSFYYTELRYSSAFQSFSFDFVSTKRDKWKSAEAFEKSFTITDELLAKFVKYAEKNEKVTFDQKAFTTSKKVISQSLKAEIARQLFVEQGYYTIMNSFDKEVIKAVQVLNK